MVTWALESAESKLRQNREKMIKYVALDVFVFYPGVIGGEDVNLDRDAVFGRLELADEQGFFLGNLRVVLEILADVGAECSQITQSTCVDAV